MSGLASTGSGLMAKGLTLPGRLEPTDLSLPAGTLTALVGPNGAGKTSLLHAIAGIGRPSGDVVVADRSLNSVPSRTRPALLGYVPASRDLAWPLDVRAFVTLTAPGATADTVDAILDALTLTPLAARRVDSLSTGERTRVLIARALLPRPALLLLDEPFANLDPLWQLRLAAYLRDAADAGTTILLSAHDLDLAGRLGDRVLIMEARRIVGDSNWTLLMRDGIVARVFGVERVSDGRWTTAISSDTP